MIYFRIKINDFDILAFLELDMLRLIDKNTMRKGLIDDLFIALMPTEIAR